MSMDGAACDLGGFTLRRAGEARGFVLRTFLSITVMAIFVAAPAAAVELACVDAQPTASAGGSAASMTTKSVRKGGSTTWRR